MYNKFQRKKFDSGTIFQQNEFERIFTLNDNGEDFKIIFQWNSIYHFF